MKSRDLMKGHYNILMNLLFTPTKEFSELLRTFSTKKHKGRLFNLKKLLDAMFIRGWCFLFFYLSVKQLALTLGESFPYSELFWSYFPIFGLETARYSACLRIQSKCGKLQTRITPNTNTF